MSSAYENRPFASAAAVTKSDSILLKDVRGLWIGTAGDLTVTLPDDSTATLKNVANGSLILIKAKFVNAASTAADIVALS